MQLIAHVGVGYCQAWERWKAPRCEHTFEEKVAPAEYSYGLVSNVELSNAEQSSVEL